jgi:hypothetical protein
MLPSGGAGRFRHRWAVVVIDAGALGSAESAPGHLIRPQQITITSVAVVDNDTFPADGGTLRWDDTTARTVHLGNGQFFSSR